MPTGLFDQPFVHCGVCHRGSSPEDPLYLTSCAHTLCSQHMNAKFCPICQINDILVIKLTETKQLPDEIKMLFQPIPSLLENLHNVSQFQITGMVNQCHYYQDVCEKLKEKCSRQRQLLYQAKQELDSVAQLKSRITELEAQLQSQSTTSTSSVFSGLRTNYRATDTVDLTMDENSNQEESFIRKLKTTNLLRNKRHMVDLPNSDGNSDSSISDIMAESTQLDKQEAPRKRSSDLSNFSNNLPQALNKLRIVKRNHTFNNANGNKATSSKGHQGLVTHMRSSSSSNSTATTNTNMRAQTQTNLLMRRNTISRGPIGSSQRSNSSNKFRRIR